MGNGGESMIHFLNHLTFSPSRLYCLDIPVASNFIINSCVIFIYKFSRTNEERMRVSSTYKTKITQRVNFNSKCSHLFFFTSENGFRGRAGARVPPRTGSRAILS